MTENQPLCGCFSLAWFFLWERHLAAIIAAGSHSRRPGKRRAAFVRGKKATAAPQAQIQGALLSCCEAYFPYAAAAATCSATPKLSLRRSRQ
jgi:hypothetical protein